MNTFCLSRLITVIGFIALAGCITGQPAQVLTDGDIPAASKPDVIKEQQAYLNSIQPKEQTPISDESGIICSNSSRFSGAVAEMKFPVDGAETCIFQVQLHCGSQNSKLPTKEVHWNTGELRGVSTVNSRGELTVPVKRADRYGQIRLRIGKFNYSSDFKNKLVVMMPTDSCN